MYLPVGQSSHAAAPAPLYLPSGHTVHVSIDLSPFSLEYFPAVQLTQVRKEEEFWELSNQVPFGHRRVGIGVGRREGVGGSAASNPFAKSTRRRSPATTVLATILCEHRVLSQECSPRCQISTAASGASEEVTRPKEHLRISPRLLTRRCTVQAAPDDPGARPEPVHHARPNRKAVLMSCVETEGCKILREMSEARGFVAL